MKIAVIFSPGAGQRQRFYDIGAKLTALFSGHEIITCAGNFGGDYLDSAAVCEAERSGGYLGQAKELLRAGEQIDPRTEAFAESFARRDSLGLLQTLVPMEKVHREQLLALLQQWKALLLQALTYRSGVRASSALAQSIAQGRSAAEILTAIRHLDKAQEYAQGNVSVGAVCGYLVWALR